MNKNFTYAFFALFLLAATKLQAQSRPDSTLTESERSAVNLYNKSMGDRLGIYRGPAIEPYTLGNKGTPNFNEATDYYADGTVNYDNRIYYHVPLIYNTERDMLESRIDNNPYTLLSDRVIDFDLLGEHFVRVNPKPNDKLMVAGFYQVIYSGKIQVLAKHVKTIQVQTTGAMAVNTFNEQTTYFLKKGSVYYNVNSKSKLLAALGDKKKELQQYIKDNKLSYGDNEAHSLNVLAVYYDRLTN